MENETTEQAVDERAEALDHGAEAAQGGEAHGEVLGVAEVAMPQLDPGLFPNLIFWLLIARRGSLPDPDPGGAAPDQHDPGRAQRRDLERPGDGGDLQAARAGGRGRLLRRRWRARGRIRSKIADETKAQIAKELAALMAKADAEIAARSAESEKRVREIEASAADSVTEVARATTAEIVAALGPRPADDATVTAAVSQRLGG